MANISVTCPHCQATLETPDTMVGNQAQCPVCGKSFSVSVAPQPAPAAAPAPAPQITPPSPSSSSVLSSSASPIAPALLVPVLIAVVALIIAVISLFLSLTGGLPQVSFKSSPDDAVQSYLAYELKVMSSRNYYWRKNGKDILKSLEIVETKENGDWAVVFYKMSLGTTVNKDAMILHKTKDGYWVRSSWSKAADKVSDKWVGEMRDKARDFTKDSKDFDESDI